MPYKNIPEKNQICCGGHLPKPSIKLNAGSLSMIYEDGNIRSISAGRNEIIRKIYSAVRDREWLTISPDISDEKIETLPDSFRIEYRCIYNSGEIKFSACYRIEGKPDNSLSFSFDGEALETFDKNRIGFCVLHPIEGYSGKPCNILHSDGNKETLLFPDYISQNQPFFDIRSMKWKVDESDYSLVFSGDVFETEDQRNWTDASYKTYCTPLSLPYPTTIQKGEKISQRLKFKAELEDIVENGNKNEVKIVISNEQASSLPLIGIGRSTRPAPLKKEEISALKKLNFDHYRVDLYLFNHNWRHEADMAAGEASGLEFSLELALFFDNNSKNQSEDFINWVDVRQPRISVINIYHKTDSVTPDHLIDTIAPLLKRTLPGIRISCGTNANFAQLNRKKPVSPHFDYMCYSIHPQEHASDNLTIVENLQAQAYTVESAMQFSDNREIWISPVNIQRRFNANIENFEHPCTKVGFPSQVDSRLMSLFGACWTTVSLKYLSEARVKGVTFFETVGERGIFQGDFSSRWPEEFRSVKGMIFPVYRVFEYLLKHKYFKVIKSTCSHPLIVESLVLSDGKQLNLILVNLSSDHKQVKIDGISGPATMKQLNADNYEYAVSDYNWFEKSEQTELTTYEQLVLKPFSVSFIDGCFNL
jgi:D-apionolactonase